MLPACAHTCSILIGAHNAGLKILMASEVSASACGLSPLLQHVAAAVHLLAAPVGVAQQ